MKDCPRRFLGIDIGGTAVKTAIVTERGEISAPYRFETGADMNCETLMQKLYRVSERALREENICGIGVSSMGIIDPASGTVVGATPNLPALEGTPLRSLLQARCQGLPISVMNDISAMARGEQWMGVAKGCRNYFCIALGAGIGGCAVLDGAVHEGAHFRANEICYLDYAGENEYLEKYTSTKCVMEEAARALGVEAIDGFAFFEAVRREDPVCTHVLDKWTGHIARLIANVIILMDPELIVIGGGISSEKELFLPRIESKLDGMLPEAFRGQTRILAAKLANDAALLGAVSTMV